LIDTEREGLGEEDEEDIQMIILKRRRYDQNSEFEN
jgi:hypothetical protein